MDLCGNWIDTFENKTKRRLRPRESKVDGADDPSSSSLQVIKINISKYDPQKYCPKNMALKR